MSIQAHFQQLRLITGIKRQSIFRSNARSASVIISIDGSLSIELSTTPSTNDSSFFSILTDLQQHYKTEKTRQSEERKNLPRVGFNAYHK